MPKRISLKPHKTTLASAQWLVNLPPRIAASGKRERHFFDNKRLAEVFCEQQRIRLDNFGTRSTSLSPGQLEEAAAAFAALQPYGMTLNEAVTDCIRRYEQTRSSITLTELFARFLASKQGKSEAYLRGLKYTLPRFAGLHGKIVSQITPQDIEREMAGMTPSVKNAFMRNLRAIFNFGVKRGWLSANPVTRLDFETMRQSEVVTLSPREAAALVSAAEQEGDGELVAYHVLGLFAGIRPLELERLDWKHIDLVERHVEITPDVSKTGRRRIIDMEDNLAEWLIGRAKKLGAVTPNKNLRTRLRAIRAAAGLANWHQDVMRHSYASYWLAANVDINRLTLFMGHESTAMLWKHYHKAAKKQDAARYWNIKPASRGRKIVSITASRS